MGYGSIDDILKEVNRVLDINSETIGAEIEANVKQEKSPHDYMVRFNYDSPINIRGLGSRNHKEFKINAKSPREALRRAKRKLWTRPGYSARKASSIEVKYMVGLSSETEALKIPDLYDRKANYSTTFRPNNRELVITMRYK